MILLIAGSSLINTVEKFLNFNKRNVVNLIEFNELVQKEYESYGKYFINERNKSPKNIYSKS